MGGLNLKQIGFDLKTLQVILVSFVLGGYFCLGIRTCLKVLRLTNKVSASLTLLLNLQPLNS